MGELYLRKVVLDIIPAIGDGKRIENLRIQFKCEKTSESKPNTSEISVFNLSEQTRSLFEPKKTRVKLQVGYLGLRPEGNSEEGFSGTAQVETIFVGNVTKVLHKVDGPDILTTISLGDGENRYRNARVEKGYPPNARLSALINDMNNLLGLAKGSQEGIPNRNYAHGLTLSGLVRDQLDMLTKSNGLEWSIQDEALQITVKGEPTKDSILVLNSDSGLIGSPGKTDKGVEFDCLIQPGLSPGRRVKLESRFMTGNFKLRKVSLAGDSDAKGTFLAKCECAK